MSKPASPNSQNQSVPSPGEPLIEGRDYVLENGLFVLTRDYLLRRGTCCGSGCRNCPYGFKTSEGETQ